MDLNAHKQNRKMCINNQNETSKLVSTIQRENYNMGQTIDSGNKPSSVALHQNRAIVYIESNTEYKI